MAVNPNPERWWRWRRWLAVAGFVAGMLAFIISLLLSYSSPATLKHAGPLFGWFYGFVALVVVSYIGGSSVVDAVTAYVKRDS